MIDSITLTVLAVGRRLPVPQARDEQERTVQERTVLDGRRLEEAVASVRSETAKKLQVRDDGGCGACEGRGWMQDAGGWWVDGGGVKQRS